MWKHTAVMPSEPESPPPSPTFSPGSISSPSCQTCICGSVPVVGTSLTANTLADSLGVSPMYKQQDSARWNAAAHAYRTSRAVSPTGDSSAETGSRMEQLQVNGTSKSSIVRTPLSLEDIATMNRKRHEMEGGKVDGESSGPLELEAIAAVHELAMEVCDISVSEMLPRTSDLIFVNVKTQEGQDYTLELTLKGWRIASSHTDCMNGDYTKISLHTKYYHDARQLLNFISPNHTTRFNAALTQRLEQLATNEPIATN